jgi:hypothetical protein
VKAILINNQSYPTRCELCHQSVNFKVNSNPITNLMLSCIYGIAIGGLLNLFKQSPVLNSFLFRNDVFWHYYQSEVLGALVGGITLVIIGFIFKPILIDLNNKVLVIKAIIRTAMRSILGSIIGVLIIRYMFGGPSADLFEYPNTIFGAQIGLLIGFFFGVREICNNKADQCK